MRKLLQFNPNLHVGMDLIRVLLGGIIISFGIEIFSAEQMVGYTEWLTKVGIPLPGFMAYLGKVAELVGGALLLVGLFTRLSSIPLIITMFVVNFIMLDGNIRSEPFYLLLLFLIYLFVGSGKLSLDFLIGRKKSLHLS
ncbi:MAG: DoxX family protein [Bacteroidia bacterium]|nr:DoxX family protein [Bacteroidia bacterium]